jgi:hypothetical protein
MRKLLPYIIIGALGMFAYHRANRPAPAAVTSAGMKMDGDHDGVPCEDQWCRDRG